MKPVVALDMDELLFPFLDTLLPFVNERDGTSWTTEHFHVYSPNIIWEVSVDESAATIAAFFEYLEHHPSPVDGSVEALSELRENFELHIVTAREDALRPMTEGWLDHCFPDVLAGVQMCNLFGGDQALRRTKAEVCAQIDAIALVDDSPEHTAAVARSGRPAILFGNYPWNRVEELPDGVLRAHSWPETVDRLQELVA